MFTDLKKDAIKIAESYGHMSSQEKIDVIASAFGYTTGQIKTTPCYGKWRGTSDLFLEFSNGYYLPLGNDLTPIVKTKKVQKEYINNMLFHYNPEVVSLTKKAALSALKQRETIDNEIALQKGLKAYQVMSVELATLDYLGWYYAVLLIDGKLHAHMETGLNFSIKNGALPNDSVRDNYIVAGGIKEDSVDYIFRNTGFCSSSDLYTLEIPDDLRKRVEKNWNRRSNYEGTF